MKFTRMMNKKQKGYQGEAIVANDYHERGYTIVARNFTIRGGEIDIVAENEMVRVFVEVKTVNSIYDFFDFLSQKKLQALRRSIETYNHLYPTVKYIRLDIVFVRGNEIVQKYENVEF